jgi:hypothetical protein
MDKKLEQAFETLEENQQAQLIKLFNEMEANQLASEKLARQVIENRKEAKAATQEDDQNKNQHESENVLINTQMKSSIFS